MKKNICINCGSNHIDFKPKYYECRHCNTKYKLPKEMEKEETKAEEKLVQKKNFFSTKLMLIVVIINILLFVLYASWNKNEAVYQSMDNTPVMINNSHAQIGTQSIVINNYSIENKIVKNQKFEPTDMSYWNIVLKDKHNSYIDALTATKFGSYIMIANGEFLELDRKGNQIWSRKFVAKYSSTRRKAITVDKNYIFSYGGHRDGGETVIFDAQKSIKLKLPIHFHSLVGTDNGFIGVTMDAIKHINLQGEELWSKSLNRSVSNYSRYNEVIKLEKNTFVELGVDKENILWISKYTIDGSLLWQYQTTTYKTFINNVVATSDGGFIISAGRYIKIFKYNSQGELEWSSKESKYRKAKAYAIIEASDGYIHLNRLPNGFVVAKLDYDGNVLWEQKYQGKKRILLNGITNAFDGAYLLAVKNELGYAWLVKMSEQGEIRADFDDERYRFNANTKLLLESQVSRKDKMITHFNKTGGNCNRVTLSSDENYLYATALASGFYIYDVHNPLNPKELSQFSKSKTKFHFYKNGAYGPVSSSVSSLKGDYAYNMPQDFLISSDDKRAYVIDILHGFYILDIEDKKHPKLLASFKNLKGTSLAFSNNKKEIFLPTIDIAKGEMKLVSINVENPNEQHTFKTIGVSKHPFDGYPLYRNYTEYPINLVPIKRNRVLISYRTHILLFDLNEEEVLHTVNASNRIFSMELSPNKKEFFVSTYSGIFIYSANSLKLTNSIASAGKFLKFSKDGQQLYREDEKSRGLLVQDISDINNPKTVKIYKSARNSLYNITLSKNEKILYIASGMNGLGVVEVE